MKLYSDRKGGGHMRRIIALLLVLCTVLSMPVLPAYAAGSEDPLAKKDYEKFGSAATETTAPSEPEETEPEETDPAQKPADKTDDKKQDKKDGKKDDQKESSSVLADLLAKLKKKYNPEEEAAKNTDPNAPRGHNGVPLYFQNDYPDEVYGEGTVASNGCSAASLAMVATYLTGREYLPDEIARYFGDSAENNIARLEKGSEAMKLPFRKAANWHETEAALEAGKVVIALMDNRSLFTTSQHFIILTGLNDKGRIMVNDSQKTNYDKWDIKKGLREGFTKNDILLGYEGAWIYDKAAMPKEPFLYYEPEPVRGECRYDFTLTEDEKWFIAKVVWVEARGESREGQQAVAEVILNRMASSKFPDTPSTVVYAANQFNSAKFLDTAKPYQMQYEAVENALLGPYVLPEDVFYFATTPKTSKVWGKIGGHIFCYADY